MNESWKQAEADAHEAKAEALETAMDALLGVVGALDPLAVLQLDAMYATLRREKERNDTAATLAREKAPA